MRNIARMSWPTALAITGMIAGLAIFTPGAHGKSASSSELDLEPALRSAALVVAVRVESVHPLRVVYGGKSSQTIHQYTFTPIRVLKGVYSRPQLVMTSADLHPYAYDFDPRVIESGQQRLLLLGRSGIGYYGIHRGSSADESFPLLQGTADPLVSASATLIGLQDERDRFEIVSRLSRELRAAEGRGAVVLLAALERRRYIAAQRDDALQAVVRQLESDEAAVRQAAANVLGNLLEADYLTNDSARKSAVEALVASQAKPGTLLVARVAALEAMSSVPDAVRENEDAVRLVQPDTPYETLAERAARLDILGRLLEDQDDAVAETLAGLLAVLPLDAAEYMERSAARAWARIAGVKGAEQLLDRLRRKKALGLEGVAEIEAFGLILPKTADPWPLQRALIETGLTMSEQPVFVRACEDSPSAQLVRSLSDMLDPRHPHLRRIAADLLMEINTKAAAIALRPHLAEEGALDYKLELAAFLGRHGFDDGYAYALEHMSDPRYLEAAVKAIAAIGRPGSADQMLDIFDTSHDFAWKQAAVRALGLLGQDSFADELSAMTSDLDQPLAASALQARADLGDEHVLELLPAALSSRSDDVVTAAARAAGTLLPQAADRGTRALTEIRSSLAALAGNRDTTEVVRQYALEALVTTEDPQLERVLVTMIRDSRLEETELMNRVQQLTRERKVRL